MRLVGSQEGVRRYDELTPKWDFPKKLEATSASASPAPSGIT